MYFSSPEQFKEQCGYEINGFWYPRVTKIVGIKSKPALYRYYGEAASFAAAEAQTQKSAEEGTLIHETVQSILTGGQPAIDDSIAPAVNAFVEFLDRNNIQVDAQYIEHRILNLDHAYAGTIDALALIGGKFGVMDIKTSMDFYRDYNLQTSAYMDALIKDPSVTNPQTRWILRIDQIKTCQKCKATMRPKGGREKIRKAYPLLKGIKTCPENEHEWGPLTGITAIKEESYWQKDFEAFLAAKKLWEWENDFWLRKIGYLK
ncbi:MAG: hypothetical protein Q8Q37_01450 [bacterium]|nr:hypothetical protein [bacterium]